MLRTFGTVLVAVMLLSSFAFAEDAIIVPQANVVEQDVEIAEYPALLDTTHPLNAEQQKMIDDMDFSDIFANDAAVTLPAKK